jgi:hypothetical protein
VHLSRDAGRQSRSPSFPQSEERPCPRESDGVRFAASKNAQTAEGIGEKTSQGNFSSTRLIYAAVWGRS